MNGDLTNIGSLEAWTAYMQGLMAYSGDPSLIDDFDWSTLETLTVADYLALLDTAEAFLASFDWSILASQLSFIESSLLQSGLPQSQIDEALAFLNDFIAGDLSLITEAFDFIRAQLSGVPGTLELASAIQGLETGGGFGSTETGTASDDAITGTAFEDTLSGAGGNDTIDGLASDDTLKGNAGNDTLKGGKGNDVAKGGGGSDKVLGASGKDKLFGNDGGDTIKGGGGRDVINGGKGKDTLFGDGGRDKFIFKAVDGSDTIRDFTVGEDRIKIKGADGLQDLTFTASGSDVLVEYQGLDVLVEDTTLAALQNADNFLF